MRLIFMFFCLLFIYLFFFYQGSFVEWLGLEMWALGIVGFFVAVGSYPFNMEDGALTLLDRISNVEFEKVLFLRFFFFFKGALFCFALFCFVLFCFALFCFVLFGCLFHSFIHS